MLGVEVGAQEESARGKECLASEEEQRAMMVGVHWEERAFGANQ